MKTLQIGHDPDPGRRIRRRQGELIRQTRQLRQMSTSDLAVLVGVSAGAVSQWETGRYAPRQKHQIALAKVLDVPWSMIFGLDAESVA